MIVLRYEDGNIRIMLVVKFRVEKIIVLRFMIPVACAYGLLLV